MWVNKDEDFNVVCVGGWTWSRGALRDWKTVGYVRPRGERLRDVLSIMTRRYY